MGMHAHRPEGENPFLRHALLGWEPDHPHIRYPVTIGVYPEGENRGLFLAPVDLATVRRSLSLPDTDSAWVLGGAQVLDNAFVQAHEPPRLLPWSAIDTLGEEVDIIHLPAGTEVTSALLDISTPLLAAPESAVPQVLGSRVAIGLNDGCHLSLITPEPGLIEQCVRQFVADYLVSVLQHDARLPPWPEALIQSLVAPLSPGAWQELHFYPRRRYWVLDIVRKGEQVQVERWVCEGEHGRWRGGWYW
jgi:hypothetical protein